MSNGKSGMTLGEAKKAALMLLDEYTQEAAPYTSDTDIARKLNSLFNIAQFEAAQVKRIVRSFEATQNPPLSAVPQAQNPAKMYTHTDCDVTFRAVGGKAYCFAVDDDCIVYFERNGVQAREAIEHHTQTPGVFTRYKGMVSGGEEGEELVLRFSGGSYYNIENVAIWACEFASEESIPDYQRFIPYEFPEGFAQLSKIEADSEPPIYRVTSGCLLVDSYFRGAFRVEYFAWPSVILDDTPDSYVFDVSPDAALCLPYGVAADILKSDPSADYSAFEAKYAGKLANLDPRATNMTTVALPLLGYLPY